MTQNGSKTTWSGEREFFRLEGCVSYQIALLKTGPAKIQERIVDAQLAILKRAQVTCEP
jgi:hypothetical protein